MPPSQVTKSCFDSQASLLQSLSHCKLQTAQPLPQGLSEEALKEALQVQSIWVESQDVQEARCQEIEREVGVHKYCMCAPCYLHKKEYQQDITKSSFRRLCCPLSYKERFCAVAMGLHKLTQWFCQSRYLGHFVKPCF